MPLNKIFRELCPVLLSDFFISTKLTHYFLSVSRLSEKIRFSGTRDNVNFSRLYSACWGTRDGPDIDVRNHFANCSLSGPSRNTLVIAAFTFKKSAMSCCVLYVPSTLPPKSRMSTNVFRKER